MNDISASTTELEASTQSDLLDNPENAKHQTETYYEIEISDMSNLSLQRKQSPIVIESRSAAYQSLGGKEVPAVYDRVNHQTEQQHSTDTAREHSDDGQTDNRVIASDELEIKLPHQTKDEFKKLDQQQSYRRILCIYFIAILVVFLVAIISLILSLVLLFSLNYAPQCECGVTPQEVANIQTEMQALRKALNDLRNTTEVYEQNITAVSSELMQLNSDLDTIRENVTAAANDVINQCITEDGTIIGLNFSVQLSGVRLYDGCETRIESTCTVSPSAALQDDGSAVCITAASRIREDDTYVVDASCVRHQDSTEQNPFLTLLDVFDSNNQMFCYCYVVVPNYSATPFAQPATCGLQVTRCPKTLSIPANIVTTQTNFN